MKYLVLFVEEEAEVCEDHPEFLPAIAVLELAQQIATELILQRQRLNLSLYSVTNITNSYLNIANCDCDYKALE